MGTGFKPGWEAGLELRLDGEGSKTRLAHARHWGPLRVQRPFYPGGNGACHLYLLHPPGGMVSGDSIDMDIRLERGALTLLTTPSAGKIYRGNATVANQRQHVVVELAGESLLEWMPLETIVFDGARGELSLRVNLDSGSHCALWDIVCLGRPASGESFGHGYLRQRLALFRDGAPLYVESNDFSGGADMLLAPWGLQGRAVSGTFLASTQLTAVQVQEARALLAPADPAREMLALSQMDGLLALRYLGDSAESCRKHFLRVWRHLKATLQESDFVEPRIWNT